MLGGLAMKKYHVFSAKNFCYESVLGDGTYDYFVFPADEFGEYDARSLFEEVTKETLKANNHWYTYTAYEYRGTAYCGEHYGKQYYEVLYNGLFDEWNVPYIP